MEIRTIKEKFNPEIALIILCCRVFLKTGDIESLRLFIANNNIYWDKVYHLSKEHRIRPIIFNILFQVKELVEEKTFQLYRSFCINFSSRILSRKAESDRIINLLFQRGIHVRQYKGLEFSSLIYKDMGLRESADMDIIIAEEDLDGLIDTMINEGYEMKKHQFYDMFPAQYLRLHKDACFDKPGIFGGSFNFEFHYRPTKYRMNMMTSFNQLLGNDYLSSYRQYGYDDYYKLMLINNGVSDYYPTLRSLLDLVFFHEDKPVNHELKRFDLLRRVLSDHLFNLPFTGFNEHDDRSLHNTSRLLLNRLLKRPQILHSELLWHIFPALKFSKGIRNKWKILSQSFIVFITPAGNDIAGVRLPFYALYYFAKPFLLIARKFNRLRSAP